MAEQRIKGQEVTITVVRGGVLEASFTDIKNFNFVINSEVKKQGYLGEKGSRVDDVFDSVDFDFEMHVHNTQWANFVVALQRRQKRELPDLEINIAGTFFYPNFETQAWVLPAARFAPIPVGVPDRKEYVNVKLSGSVGDFQLQDL